MSTETRSEQMLSSAAIAAGVVWTMTRWIDEQPRRPVEDVDIQLRDLLEATVFGGLGGPAGTAVREEAVLHLSGAVS